jgi:hypothetical protein
MPPAIGNKTDINQQLMGALALVVDVITLTAQQAAEKVYQQRVEQERRDKVVLTEEGAEFLGMKPANLSRLAKDGRIKSRREEGTRRYYFRVGDLVDWRASNSREDGGIKGTHRNSAPGAKKKG